MTNQDIRDYHGQPIKKGDVVRRVRDAGGVRSLKHRNTSHLEAVTEVASGQIKTELSTMWESSRDFEVRR
jgi:hypothetical protein